MKQQSKAQRAYRALRRRLAPARRWFEGSPFAVPLYYACEGYYALRAKALLRCRVSQEDRQNVERNVTFIFKSFNRQASARRTYRSIRAYYPLARIVIADDSAPPLQIDGAHIIHLPFNSGLSKGIAAALEQVQTPYVVRLDDDMLLTPRTRVHDQLAFLQRHPEVDLCAFQAVVFTAREAARYSAIRMRGKSLVIPAGTLIDGREVVYKPPNCFVARTEAVRKVGYDPNIRMIDHHEFFYRAAGQIVCAQDRKARVCHCHNRFDRAYRPYRNDTQADSAYIRMKHGAAQRGR